MSCTQKKDKINLDGEQTVIFRLNKAESASYNRSNEDNEYFIDPFIFKPDSTRKKRRVLYQDVKNKLISTDSFWGRWWEEKERVDAVNYQLYLFMTEHNGDREGQLLP